MQVRGLIAAVGLLVLLGGLVWWSNRAEKAKEGKPAPDAPPKLVEITSDQIQQVEIVKGGETTTVRRNAEDKWELTSPKAFRADQDAVSSLVGTFSSLSSDRVVEEKASDLAPFGLQTPAVTVIITKKDGKTTKLYLGDETPTSGGVFARLEGDPRIFTLASWNKTSLDKSFKDLQDRRLIAFDNDKITRVEVALKGQTVEFGKNNQNEWAILKPKPMRADANNVDDLVRRLREAKADLATSDEEAKKAVAQWPGATLVAVAKVTDAVGTHSLEVRKTKDNDYYAKGSAMEGVFKAASDLGEGLNKTLEDFRQHKLMDFGWNDPTKVEIKDAGKVRTLSKTADKWMEANKQMDSVSVQSLIDKLRDLKADKFLDSGYTTPVFEATVTWKDNTRTDKVLISKSGDKYLAIREGEPTVYEIGAKAFEELQKAAADVKEPAPPPKDDKGKKK